MSLHSSTLYPDSKSNSHCSWSFMPHACIWRRSERYQFYSLCFDPTVVRTHNLSTVKMSKMTTTLLMWFPVYSNNTWTSTCKGRVMVYNAAFNNISVLLVEETSVTWENHQPASSHWQSLSHNVVLSTTHHEWNSNSQLKWW